MLMQNTTEESKTRYKRKREESSNTSSTSLELNEIQLDINELSESKSVSSTRRKKNKTAKDKQWWTTKEDEKLRKAVEMSGAKNWKLISERANVGKSDVQCLQRWTQVLRPGLKKGTWSKEEDQRLTVLVREASESEANQIPWKKIEKEMGGRTAKQCRERWKLSLDPNINKTVWSKEEDMHLMRLQSELGNSWSKIKDILGTNRTENAVKLRFKCLKKREEKYQRNISSLQATQQQFPVMFSSSYQMQQPEHELDLRPMSRHSPMKAIDNHKQEALDLKLPLPSSARCALEDFSMYEVKPEPMKQPELEIEASPFICDTEEFDNFEFDEVLQILSDNSSNNLYCLSD